jgi:hypothetical protein
MGSHWLTLFTLTICQVPKPDVQIYITINTRTSSLGNWRMAMFMEKLNYVHTNENVVVVLDNNVDLLVIQRCCLFGILFVSCLSLYFFTVLGSNNQSMGKCDNFTAATSAHDHSEVSYGHSVKRTNCQSSTILTLHDDMKCSECLVCKLSNTKNKLC